MTTRPHTGTGAEGGFRTPLARLEDRALEIQLEHFKIPPERRGRLFYALELAGEVGELLNGCKKFIRTRLADRRNEMRTALPSEAADVLIALMLLKLAAKDGRHVAVARTTHGRMTLPWLHGCLSELACAAARLYAREQAGKPFGIGLYRRVVGLLLGVASFFSFDLETATHAKLSAIVTKVNAGYYD